MRQHSDRGVKLSQLHDYRYSAHAQNTGVIAVHT